MKTFKELREENLEIEYSNLMENHPFVELTTEELVDILLDETLDEGHRFNAAYVLETRDELSEGILGAAFGAGKNLLSKGLSAAKGLFTKKAATHPMTQKMAQGAETAAKKEPGIVRKALGSLAKNAAITGGIEYGLHKLQGSEAKPSDETPSSGSTSSTKPSKPKTSTPSTSSDSSTETEPKKPSVFDDPEFKKDVEKYRSSVPKGTSALEDPAFKKDAASYWASKNKPAEPKKPSTDIHSDIAKVASQNPDTKAATKTLSSIRKGM